MTDSVNLDDTRMPLTSADVLGERMEGLRELIPEAFVEGKVDFDRLKAALGEFLDEGRERYGLSWCRKPDRSDIGKVGNFLPMLGPCPYPRQRGRAYGTTQSQKKIAMRVVLESSYRWAGRPPKMKGRCPPSTP